MHSRSNISSRIFALGHSGGQPSRPWRFANYYWEGRVRFQCCFSPPGILKNGSRVLCNGTFWRSNRFVRGRDSVHVQRCPFIPRFQDLRNLPDVAQLVYIQMTLMPAFDKLVVRGHVLNRSLYLLSVWTMQRYPRVSNNFLLCLEASPLSYTETSALEKQLQYFLASLSPPKCVSSCALGDIIRFLIGKHKSCRTVVHRPSWSTVVRFV